MANNADQDYLDGAQYSDNEILKFEAIFGHGYISTGGKESTDQLLKILAPHGKHVLDVGSGVGGSAFAMAQDYGAQVHGLDLSANMFAIADQRLARLGLGDKVRFEHRDVMTLAPTPTYDIVYSRDVLLHIHDKPPLLDLLRSVLVPGGQLFMTDYCSGAKPWSDIFASYIKRRDYCVHTFEEYGALLERAGFEDVHVEDRTPLFLAMLRSELARLPNAGLPAKDTAELVSIWEMKIARASAGEHRWALLRATNPETLPAG